MLTPFHFAWREILFHRAYALLFLLALGFGAASLSALRSFGAAIDKTLADQARELSTSDLNVEGSQALLDQIQAWAGQRWPGAGFARSVDTVSMVRSAARDRTAQVSLRAVSPGYPLYGAVRTGSGGVLSSALRPGQVVAGPKLLSELGLAPGAVLRLGQLDVRLADTVAARSDQSVSFFEFSPVVFITMEDLAASGLIVPGSRARTKLYINLPPGVPLEKALAEVKAQAAGETSEVDSWQTDSPGVRRFLRRTLLFMDFLGLLTLTLGGIGVASALSAALAAAQRSMGMSLALGAPRSYLIKVWAWWASLLTAGGLAAALMLGLALTRFLMGAFGDLLPAGFSLGFPVKAWAQAGATALAVCALFILWPLLRLWDVPPNNVLSHADEKTPASWRRALALAVPGAALFYILIWWNVGRWMLALQYTGGVMAVLGFSWLAVFAAFKLLRLCVGRARSVPWRLAVRGLSRPGNLNEAVVVSVAVSLVVIVALFLLERNLTSRFIDSYPEDAPNVFFINIQKNQVDAFKARIARPDARLHPLIRGRVVRVNDAPVRELNRRGQSLRGGGDNLTREFGFTFGEELLPTDRVSAGPGLWDKSISGPQVSVFQNFHERFGINVGDKITVNILGRTLTATVSSLREIDQSSRQPFYYFYFRPGLIDDAPYTLMAGLHIPKEKIQSLENALAQEMPNVTTIDLSDVAALAGKIIHRLTRIVNVLGLFGVLSGLLLLISNIWTTLVSRTCESVLYRTLGATRGQVTRIYLAEYVFIGGAAAISAWAVGTGAGWVIMKFGFDMPFDPHALWTLSFLFAAVAVLVGASWLASRAAFRAAPMEVLRYE